MIGLYGVISYGASRRQSEIGVRVALGAQPGSVVWLVLRDVVLLFLLGAVAGVAVSLAAGRLVKGLLYGVRAYDPATMTIALAMLGAAAAIAGYLPARRSARMDPMAALRNE
jgi:ABC-type antimicrobial peptide transport system permease subunit